MQEIFHHIYHSLDQHCWFFNPKWTLKFPALIQGSIKPGICSNSTSLLLVYKKLTKNYAWAWMAKLLKKAYEHQIPFASCSSSPYHGITQKATQAEELHRQKRWKGHIETNRATESHTCSSSSSSICFTGNSSIIAPARERGREGGRLGLFPSATKNKKQVHVVIITTSGNRYRSRKDARKKKLQKKKHTHTFRRRKRRRQDNNKQKKKRTADSVRNEDAKETKCKEDESKPKKEKN